MSQSTPVPDAADDSPVGCIGTLLIATRGADGPGEVLVAIRGGRETFLAYSDHPMSCGETVLVVEQGPHRRVTVVAWTDPFARSAIDPPD
jgi:hypothetical protein